MLSTNVVVSQNNAYVSGTVKERSGNSDIPMYSVNVVLSGIDRDIVRGSMTDMEGKYRIKAPHGKYVLQFSFIGYNTIEDTITISNEKDIFIDKYLEENTQHIVRYNDSLKDG